MAGDFLCTTAPCISRPATGFRSGCLTAAAVSSRRRATMQLFRNVSEGLLFRPESSGLQEALLVNGHLGRSCRSEVYNRCHPVCFSDMRFDTSIAIPPAAFSRSRDCDMFHLRPMSVASSAVTPPQTRMARSSTALPGSLVSQTWCLSGSYFRAKRTSLRGRTGIQLGGRTVLYSPC